MLREDVITLLSEIRARLEKIYGTRLKGVYLFGSYARRQQDSESDLDVLVVLDEFDRYSAEVDRTSDLGAVLSLSCGVSISQVFVRERDWLSVDTPFLVNVREETIPA